MKKYLLLFTTILLTGCAEQVRNYNIEQAIDLCKEHKGIFHIHKSSIEFGVRCNDGLYTNLKQ